MAGATPRATTTAATRKSGSTCFEYHCSPIGTSINVDGASLSDLSVYKKGGSVDGAIWGADGPLQGWDSHNATNWAKTTIVKVNRVSWLDIHFVGDGRADRGRSRWNSPRWGNDLGRPARATLCLQPRASGYPVWQAHVLCR
jgi:hypothetical protein